MKIPSQLHEMLAREKRCFLATCYGNKPHLSLMIFTYLANENIVILSSRADTTKVYNIMKNPQAALLIYSLGEEGEPSCSCTLHGTAKIISNSKEQAYREAHRQKHPDMDSFIDGEDISIIAFQTEHITIADSKDNVKNWSAETR